MLWNGKHKALTFSFDDGVKQDIEVIKILDEYGLKATFNINSGSLGCNSSFIDRSGREIKRDKVARENLKEIYKNHEIAVHTVDHYNLTTMGKEDVIYQVEQDRLNLESLVGYSIKMMAYPCGGVNNDQRTAKIIKENTAIRFARTTTSTYSFELQQNYMQFNPTVYYIEIEKLFELGEKFIRLETEKNQLFYIWGHTYELDSDKIQWETFRKFCKLVSSKKDIFYGTNFQVFKDYIE